MKKLVLVLVAGLLVVACSASQENELSEALERIEQLEEEITTTTTTTTTTQAPKLKLIIEVTCGPGRGLVCTNLDPGCSFGTVYVKIKDEGGILVGAFTEESARGRETNPRPNYTCVGDWTFEVDAYADFYQIDLEFGNYEKRYGSSVIDGSQWRELPNQTHTESFRVL